MSKGTEMDMATAVKERPMIFSGPMVKALLEDRKTQTRRVIRNPEKYSHIRDCGFCCPHGQPGEILWVRETWRCNHIGGHRIEYRAGGACLEYHDWPKDVIPPYVASDSPSQIRRTERQLAGEKIPDAWRSPFHLPRWAARIILEITEVRVERVQEIGYRDCVAEGIPPVPVYDDGAEPETILRTIRDEFRKLWDSINGKRPGCAWIDNPWTWAITFKRLKP